MYLYEICETHSKLQFIKLQKLIYFTNYVDPFEKIAQYKEKCLNHVSRTEDMRYTERLLDRRPIGT